VLVGSADIGRNDLQDHAMLNLAALRVLELGIGNILNLDFAWLGVNNTAIFAHDNLFDDSVLCFPVRRDPVSEVGRSRRN